MVPSLVGLEVLSVVGAELSFFQFVLPSYCDVSLLITDESRLGSVSDGLNVILVAPVGDEKGFRLKIMVVSYMGSVDAVVDRALSVVAKKVSDLAALSIEIGGFVFV